MLKIQKKDLGGDYMVKFCKRGHFTLLKLKNALGQRRIDENVFFEKVQVNIQNEVSSFPRVSQEAIPTKWKKWEELTDEELNSDLLFFWVSGKWEPSGKNIFYVAIVTILKK